MKRNENVPREDGGERLGGDREAGLLTVGKKGFTVEADPKRSCSGSGVPRKMKGAGDDGEAKKGSSLNDVAVVSSGSPLVWGSANMSDLTLGARPSGRSSGPGIKDSQSLLVTARCQSFL